MARSDKREPPAAILPPDDSIHALEAVEGPRDGKLILLAALLLLALVAAAVAFALWRG